MSKDLLNLDNLSTYWEITSPSGILIDGIKKVASSGIWDWYPSDEFRSI